jgi:hypothetical protein
MQVIWKNGYAPIDILHTMLHHANTHLDPLARLKITEHVAQIYHKPLSLLQLHALVARIATAGPSHTPNTTSLAKI